MAEGFRRLTGRQRYRQAVIKARIHGNRSMRLFLRGELNILPCLMDLEQDCIEREIERAYAAGEAHGRTQS